MTLVNTNLFFRGPRRYGVCDVFVPGLWTRSTDLRTVIFPSPRELIQG